MLKFMVSGFLETPLLFDSVVLMKSWKLQRFDASQTWFFSEDLPKLAFSGIELRGLTPPRVDFQS